MGIKLTAWGYWLGTEPVAGGEAVDRIFTQVFNQLDAKSKRAWIALAICALHEVHTDELMFLWSSHISPDDLSKLARFCVVTVAHWKRRTLTMSASMRYVAFTMRHEQPILDFVAELETAAMQNAGQSVQLALHVVAQLLMRQWLKLDKAALKLWIMKLLPLSVNRNLVDWYTLLNSYYHSDRGEVDSEFATAYGICLRQLAKWEEAEAVFDRVIQITGMEGQFRLQAKALLEQSVLFRYRGMYQKAAELVERAANIALRKQEHELVAASRLERAQLALDMGSGNLALDYLAGLPDSGRCLLLKSETRLLLKQYHECIKIAQHAATYFHEDRKALARLHSLLGRAQSAQGGLEDARRHFSLACAYLETEHEPFALARSWSNLGGLLIEKGDFAEAKQFLSRAERIQSTLVDKLGLSITRHNLQILRRSGFM